MTIRKQPSDFYVEELLAPETLASIYDRADGNNVHALYELNKASLTTPAAINEFCRSVKARPDHASYAGLKDKHAETRQHVTVKLRTPADAPRDTEGKQWKAHLKGFINHPIVAADITGNRFAIVIRDLARPASEEMDRRAKLLANGDSLLLTNYFGAQRFGSARHGAGWIAKSLITGDFETALKLAIGTPARKDTGKTRDFTRILATHWGNWKAMKDLPRLPEGRAIDVLARGGDFKAAFESLPYFLQSLSVEAYQSHLWNRCACELVRPMPGNFATPDEYGEMLFAPASTIHAPWRNLDLPLLAKNSDLLDPWKETCERVLASENITVADLRVKGLKRPFFGEAQRKLFIEAKNWSLSRPEPDELSKGGLRKRTASFDLPRGAYATVVLRALGQ
ncbi:MAG: tRNA pseudouridine(13) synthase TruD [Phycisphaerales bacterium]|nr:tRNA pseudouridine(13) synthase TruD [Phycisphaerales bacterium]